MKKVLAIFGFSMVAASAALAQNVPPQTPAGGQVSLQIKQDFTASCRQSGGTDQLCSCVYDDVTRRMSGAEKQAVADSYGKKPIDPAVSAHINQLLAASVESCKALAKQG